MAALQGIRKSAGERSRIQPISSLADGKEDYACEVVDLQLVEEISDIMLHDRCCEFSREPTACYLFPF